MSRLPTIRPPGPISRLADAAFTCGRILRSGLYGDLGWRVVWTYARLKFLSMFDAETPGADPQQTQVAGWRVRYWGTRFLATLFGTKFVKLEYLFDTNAPRPRIIDCGANIGMAILFFKTLYPDAEIVAFEPDPRTFKVLAGNVRDNNLAAVTLHNAAVGATDGAAPLHVQPDIPGSALSSLVVVKDAQTVAEAVPVVRLSRYIDAPVDFLKLDVEGSEMDVLRELQAAGKLTMVREMVIEYHHHLRADEDVLAELLQILERARFGYQFQVVDDTSFGRGAYQSVMVHAYGKGAC
ncbi:MAG TPA: FkbM family methyltransferase [Gemmatimonadaceae bacterium]|nr:FkbM family methyltransferase [Gemmatimonadaceae bacterium]